MAASGEPLSRAAEKQRPEHGTKETVMLGMSLGTFTLLHVLISLLGVAAGGIAMIGWLKSDTSRIATAIFLAATVLTSATGFLFPFTKLLPSHIVGIISLVVLAVATFAFYGKHALGVWRPVYTVTAMLALYLNVFVLVIQSFLKIPLLKSLAPTQTEPPFLIVQGAVFLVLLGLTILITIRFRPRSLASY
jgi:hypothetical protein